jgi:polar amino acid transport system substrate-binding protein
MRNLTRLAAAAAIFALGAGFAQAKDWTTVRIAMDATYPPFESLDPSGQIGGFDKDIADALCAEMKVKCEFTNQAWDGIIPGLLANKYDAILSSMSITDERKKQVDFTEKYYNTPPAIAVQKDSPLKGVTPDDLKGITIGAQTSTTHANYAQEKFPGAEVKIYPSPDEYKLDLSNGRLDAAIDDVVVLDEWTKSDAGKCCKVLGVLPTDPVINGVGAGVGIRKEVTVLRDMINKAIAEIIADGTYK